MPKTTKILLIVLAVVIVLFLVIVWPFKLYKKIEEKWGKETKSTTQLQEEASTKMAEDKYDEARTILEELVKKDANNAKGWTDLGIVYMNLKDTQSAKEAFSAAAKLDPNSSSIFNLLGNTQRDTGDFEAAKKSYQKSIDLNKRQFNAYINLASLLYNDKKYDEAINVLIQGKTNIPNYLEMRYMLVSFYLNLNRTSEAKNELNEILKIKPDDNWAKERLKEL